MESKDKPNLKKIPVRSDPMHPQRITSYIEVAASDNGQDMPGTIIVDGHEEKLSSSSLPHPKDEHYSWQDEFEN